jgi:hypothetical protein
MADASTHQVQEGPRGYTVACALTDEPGVNTCADLPSAQACTHEADYPSPASKEKTGMTFVNRSDRALQIYWLDFQGNRRLYRALPPAARVMQDTFVGHNWLVATTDGICIGIFKGAPESLAFL